MDFVVPPELRDELHHKGFVRIPRSIFRLEEPSLTALKEEVDRLFQGDYDTGIYPDEIHYRPGLNKDGVTRELCNAWKSSHLVSKIVCDQVLGRLACKLMGWTSTRIAQDDILDKPPNSNTARVGFHQDGSYISDNFEPRENNCLTMWIALDDADEENGALQYAPGSHLWKLNISEQANKKDNSTNTTVSDTPASSFHMVEPEGDNHNNKYHLDPLGNAARKAGFDPEEILKSVETVCVKAGEMVVHHQNVWHGSGPNVSSKRHRKAIVSHLMNGAVLWRSDGIRPHYIYGRYYIRGEAVPREDFFPITYCCTQEEEEVVEGNITRGNKTVVMHRTSWLDDID